VGEYLDQKKRETRDNAAVKSSRGMRLVLTIVALITCATVWILPSFVVPAAEVPSPERVEASARMTIFLASERVRAFHRAKGRLPVTLAEAGVDSADIGYFRSSDTGFDMWMTANGGRINYRSTMNSAEFLGTTLQTLSTSR
jgi:hypothetical protein